MMIIKENENPYYDNVKGCEWRMFASAPSYCRAVGGFLTIPEIYELRHLPRINDRVLISKTFHRIKFCPNF